MAKRRKSTALFTFQKGKKARKPFRPKKISLVGLAKKVSKGREEAKLFKLRHLQTKKKSIFD